MFTGIIETIGTLTSVKQENSNVHLTVKSDFTNELKIDQSVAHNGVCLTVVSIEEDEYVVTAIQETLDKTTIGNLQCGDLVNLERGMRLGDRLDGHIVQGHVDQVAECIEVKNEDGSWLYTFQYDKSFGNVTIEKGSITINGISLTVFNSTDSTFSVAIIPYTYEHTTIHKVKVGTWVNLEFDVIGKYVSKLYSTSK